MTHLSFTNADFDVDYFMVSSEFTYFHYFLSCSINLYYISKGLKLHYQLLNTLFYRLFLCVKDNSDLILQYKI